jgi:hypothetical protein
MSYVPPQRRGAKLATQVSSQANETGFKPDSKSKTKPVKKDEFPELCPVKTVPGAKHEVTKPALAKMNFASLFKNVLKKKNKVKKLKWGTVLLTKKGMIDSLTQEEREEEEKWKDEEFQDNHLRKACERLQKSQDIRREYDPKYESPDELSVSESEPEEEEEEEVFTEDEEEDEFEPEI